MLRACGPLQHVQQTNAHGACSVERVLELGHIALNKNTVPGDKSAMVPHGIRMGAPALTSRGFVEQDFAQVAEFVHRGIEITKELKSRQSSAPPPSPTAWLCLLGPLASPACCPAINTLSLWLFAQESSRRRVVVRSDHE